MGPQGFARYAVYHLPEGPLGSAGAAWLGWDAARGMAVAPKAGGGLDPAPGTAGARRYGFHATMKAPFRLADGVGPGTLLAALRGLAAAEPAVWLQDGLRLTRIDGFLALVPARHSPALCRLEGRLVRGLDRFRAPVSAAEIARRERSGLDPRQRRHLLRWGYPHVLDRFRFHLTLTDALDPARAALAENALRARLAGPARGPLVLASLSLMGEAEDGFFHQLARVPLAG